MRPFPRVLTGILLLPVGGTLLFTLDRWPWHLARGLWPLYSHGALDLALGVWSVGSAAVALAVTRRGGGSRLTRLTCGAAVWFALWSLFPTDPRQVPPLIHMGQGALSALCLAVGMHAITFGRTGRVLLALWRGILALPAGLFLGLAAGSATGLALFLELALLGGAPVISDGNCYLYLAHLLASGRVTGPIPVPADLVSLIHVPFTGGENGWFIQHPPGFAALLAVGVSCGAAWAVNPVLNGLLVLTLHGLGREVRGPALGRAAALLGVAAPLFHVFAATHLAHTAAMVALTGFVRALLACRRRGPGAPLLAGLLLGSAVAIRPYSAALLALPFAISALCRLRRRPRWFAARAALMGLGLLPPFALFLLYNQATTGGPLELGYRALHGAGHDLGFGLRGLAGRLEPFTPWMGFSHTQYRLGFIQLLLTLWPAPLLAVAAYAFRGRSGRLERLLFWGFVCVALGYGFYFSRSDWVCDPRFLLEGCPGLLVVVAIALGRLPLGPGPKATAIAAALLVALGGRFPAEATRMTALLMRDRVRVDPAVAALRGRPGLLFVHPRLYLAAWPLATDPLLERPLVTARASGRADDRFRAHFADRPRVCYLASDGPEMVVYEETGRLEDLAGRALPGVSVRTQVNLAADNRILVLRAGMPIRFRIEAGEDEALAWGWIYLGPPEGAELVVRRRGVEAFRRRVGPPGAWFFREGFLPVPAGAVEVEFTLVGPGRLGLVNPDRIRARVVTRYRPALATPALPSLE